MQDSIRKTSFRCPDCGFVQQEPENLISTYCRSCGHHYEATPNRADHETRQPPAEKPEQRILTRPAREVYCHRCGHVQEVSASARSTLCPSCNASIELTDLTFSSNVSRPVDTRGRLTVERHGYLNNTYIVCGEGLIEGRISGTLMCEGRLVLATTGAMSCRITAKSVVIERRHSVELMFPLTTQELIVQGTVTGEIECPGQVHVRRGGRLEGRIRTRSIVVDRGGVLLTESTVEPGISPKPDQSTVSGIKETGGLSTPLPFFHPGSLMAAY